MKQSGSSFYQGSPTRAKGFPALDPEERNERLRCLQTGSLSLSPGGGREGREGFRVGKRRRPPTNLDAGQRYEESVQTQSMCYDNIKTA